MNEGQQKKSSFAAWDVAENEIVVALSEPKQPQQRDGSVKGELIRAVSLKNTHFGSLSHPAMQTLIQESHSTFCRAQKLAKEATIRVDELRLLSLEYRSSLRAAQSLLTDGDVELRETLNLYELIWSLAEAIFIHSHDSSIVVDTITWSQLCLARTTYAEEVSECLRRNKISQLDKDHFWKQVAYFILSGLFSNATAFLESYAMLTKDDAIRELARLIGAMDISLLNDPNTQIDFIKQQNAIHELCDSGRLWGKGEAEKIALVVSGDPTALKRMSGLLDGWFETMPAYLLFLRPRATLSDLHDVVQECMKMCSVQSGSLSCIDQIMSAFFSLDSLRALQLICSSSPDWWIGAHLSDLLFKCDPRTTTAHGVDARQFIIIEYAKSLFAQPGMWRIGVDYLLECDDEGRENIALLIGRMPIDNEKTAIALNAICLRASLRRIAADVAESMTYRRLRERHWGSALSWAIRNGEPWLCSMVADQIILHCEPETIATITILSKLSVDMIESPSLIFLHKYFLFRNALQDGLKADAAALLIDLITSELAPKKFHSVLFADLIAILNYENEVIIDKESTLNIMQYLNRDSVEREFQSGSGVDGGDGDEDTEDLNSKVNALRYALLNNLANAIVS